MNHEHRIARTGFHLGFEIAKFGLKAAAVCAAFMTVKELHNLHKKFENHHLLHSK